MSKKYLPLGKDRKFFREAYDSIRQGNVENLKRIKRILANNRNCLIFLKNWIMENNLKNDKKNEKMKKNGMKG